MAGKDVTAVAVLSGRTTATSLRRAGQKINGQQYLAYRKRPLTRELGMCTQGISSLKLRQSTPSVRWRHAAA